MVGWPGLQMKPENSTCTTREKNKTNIHMNEKKVKKNPPLSESLEIHYYGIKLYISVWLPGQEFNT